jgi:DNA-binding transcriptional LysR family regulator
MSLRQFEYLMAVVEEGSFTLAARRLDVSQPALSHQVRALERSVGQPLLERATTGVHLTPMGRAFVPHAQSALRRAERARRSLRPEVDELRIATLYSIAIGLLPPAIRAWRSRHPSGRVEVLEYANIEELAEQMRRGVADVAIGPRPAQWDGDVRVLGEEALVVVLDAWPSERIELRELADRPWVLYAYTNSLTPVVEQACAEAGFVPRPAVRTHHTATAVRLAAAGLGPALAPASMAAEAVGGVVVWPTPPVRRELCAFGPATWSAALVEELEGALKMAPTASRG